MRRSISVVSETRSRVMYISISERVLSVIFPTRIDVSINCIC